MPRLKDMYKAEVVAKLQEKFGYKNVMQIPKIEKVVVNMGVGEAKENPKALESAVEELKTITGQAPIVTIAKNIDTYETSILPYEDCCTIFVAKHPVTKPNINIIKRSETKLEEKIAELYKEAMESVETILVE